MKACKSFYLECTGCLIKLSYLLVPIFNLILLVVVPNKNGIICRLYGGVWCNTKYLSWLSNAPLIAVPSISCLVL